MSLYNGHVLECRVTFWRGRLHNVLWDPDSTIELPEGQFQTFPEISLPKKLIWKSHRYQNKTFIRGASPGISYELWDKHTDLAIKATAWVLPRTPWRYFTGTTRIVFFIMTLLQLSSNWGYLFLTNTHIYLKYMYMLWFHRRVFHTNIIDLHIRNSLSCSNLKKSLFFQYMIYW